jgi:hypothetical protein
MITRRGARRRSAWTYFSAFHHGLCDGSQAATPNSPAPPRTIDDVRYYVGYTVGAYARRRTLEAIATDYHARALARRAQVLVK